MRWPKRRWGFVVRMSYPDGELMEEYAHPLRCWSRSGAQYKADEWMQVADDYGLGRLTSIEVKELPPPIDPYADRYWRDGTYIGPEI
jgi:hypothetical protein